MSVEKSNVVFILTDQLRVAWLSFCGESQIETPQIDCLAAKGVTLDNCISTCPVCTPYRPSSRRLAGLVAACVNDSS